MELMDLFEEDNINLNFQAKDKDDALEKLAELISNKRELLSKEEVFKVLKDREELGSTGIGNEIAIPHGKTDIGNKMFGAIAISQQGIDFGAIDKKPVKIFITLIAGKNATSIHLKILAKISRILMNETNRNLLLKAKSIKDIANVFNK